VCGACMHGMHGHAGMWQGGRRRSARAGCWHGLARTEGEGKGWVWVPTVRLGYWEPGVGGKQCVWGGCKRNGKAVGCGAATVQAAVSRHGAAPYLWVSAALRQSEVHAGTWAQVDKGRFAKKGTRFSGGQALRTKPSAHPRRGSGCES
jgi:hypothetical protein